MGIQVEANGSAAAGEVIEGSGAHLLQVRGKVDGDLSTRREYRIRGVNAYVPCRAATAHFQQRLAVIGVSLGIFLEGNAGQPGVHKSALLHVTDLFGNGQLAGLGGRTVQEGVYHAAGLFIQDATDGNEALIALFHVDLLQRSVI